MDELENALSEIDDVIKSADESENAAGNVSRDAENTKSYIEKAIDAYERMQSELIATRDNLEDMEIERDEALTERDEWKERFIELELKF